MHQTPNIESRRRLLQYCMRETFFFPWRLASNLARIRISCSASRLTRAQDTKAPRTVASHNEAKLGERQLKFRPFSRVLSRSSTTALLVAWGQAWHTSRRKLQQLFFKSRVITTSSLAVVPSASKPEIKKHYSRRVCQMRTSTKQIRIMGRKIGQGKCVFPRPRNSQTNRRSNSNRGFVG